MIAPLTVAYARKELGTLHGCGSILVNLRGTLAAWANVLRVGLQSLDRAVGNLRGAIKRDEEPSAEARP
jgi:hypothetical protein